MKNSIIRKLAALLMAATMIFALCACSFGGGNTDGDDDATSTDGSPSGDGGIPGAQKVRLEHVYTAEYLDFELPENEYINNMTSLGGLVYINTNYNIESTDADGNYTYESGANLYSMNEDGTGFTLLLNFPQENQARDDGQSYTYSYINYITPALDGTIWYFLQETFEDYSDPENYIYENTGSLVHVDTQGNELDKIDISSMADSENFYINQMLMRQTGEIVIFYDSGILVLDKDGVFEFTIPTGTNGYFGSFAITGDGDMVGDYTTYDDMSAGGLGGTAMDVSSGRKFVRINFDTKSLDELQAPELNVYSYKNGPGSTIFMYNTTAVYVYDLSTQTIKEELNWINSDIIAYRMGTLTTLEDGRFIISEYNKDYSSMHFAILSKASESEITEKYLITMAAVYPSTDILDAIVAYNKQNSEFRIQLNDYSVYNTEENWEGGKEQLNIDMVAGKIPDILLLEGLPYNNYATKGLLADLGELMDADETFNRADYLENILDATKVDGKIYSLIPYFNINTVAAKTENVGTELGWTMADLQALMGRFPEAEVFSMMSRADVLNYFSTMTMDQYVNISTGECKFNSPEFVQMLEFINTFPETIDWDTYYQDLPDDYWEQQQWQYRDNKTLLRTEYVSQYASIKDTEYTFGGDITYIGFPCPDGIGASIIPVSEIAISSKTKLTSACWEFLKSMISSEAQSSVTYSFPIRLDALNAMKELAMTEQENGGGPIVYEKASSADVGMYGDDYYAKPLTQAQADKVTNLVMSVSSVQRDNTEILSIIEEDAAAFFAGQKTAQAVADTIQSRAWIYVSENS